jgi:Ca2+:H+ antiporter
MPRSAWIFPALAVRGASVGPDLGAQRRAAAADCAAGVLLAKKFWLVVDAVAARIGAPPAFAGLLVALLILLPEGVAAVSAVRKNDLQKNINLALGSSLATIGLAIPAVGVATYALDKELTRGLSGQGGVLLLLTFFLSMLTFGTGRTNVLFGLVHMVVFAVYVFMVFVP